MPTSDNLSPPSGPVLRKAFELLVSTFEERGIRYAIIGGLAVIQHGRVRTTEDIDALLTVPQIAMAGLFESLQARGFDVDVERNIHELRDDGTTAIRFQDVIVDLMYPLLPVYAHVLDRATDAEVYGIKTRVSSVEGLIVMKLIAMRPQDVADIRDLIRGSAGKLDAEYVRKEIDSFAGADDARRADFEKWLAEARTG